MPADASRPRRLDGARVLTAWQATAEADTQALVIDALMRIVDGTWVEHYDHLDDLTRRGTVVMWIRPDLVVVWRIITEYPNYFRLVFIGSLPQDD